MGISFNEKVLLKTLTDKDNKPIDHLIYVIPSDEISHTLAESFLEEIGTNRSIGGVLLPNHSVLFNTTGVRHDTLQKMYTGPNYNMKHRIDFSYFPFLNSPYNFNILVNGHGLANDEKLWELTNFLLGSCPEELNTMKISIRRDILDTQDPRNLLFEGVIKELLELK